MDHIFSSKIDRPEAGEFAPYYEKYIQLVPDGDILQILEDSAITMGAALKSISEERSLYRYARGKWSIKEMVGHLSDTERIFSYRALRFARGDASELAGFEQDDYINAANFDAVPFHDLIDDLAAVRRSTLSFYRNLAQECFVKTGIASGSTVSVRALAFMTAGHELHHLNILKDNNLVG